MPTDSSSAWGAGALQSADLCLKIDEILCLDGAEICQYGCLQENIRANLCKLLDAHPSVINIKVRPVLAEADVWSCLMQLWCRLIYALVVDPHDVGK